MNDEFVIDRAKDLAARVLSEHPDDTDAQIRAAWMLTQGREPSAVEKAAFERLLLEQSAQFAEAAVQASKPKVDSKEGAAAAAKKTATKTASAPDAAPPSDPRVEALGSLFQSLLSSNRFLYVD
jgi:cell division septation protein DedD